MEKQTWKIGIHKSAVVSNTKVKNTNFPSPPNPAESRDSDIGFYGGYLVCESIGNVEHARLIAAAPEMLEALEEVKALRNLILPPAPVKGVSEKYVSEFQSLGNMLKTVESAIQKATQCD